MKKLPALFMITFVIALTVFGTWQLFLGNLEAAFSAFPFLLITYLFVIRKSET
jgi:membrane protein implicated in regulation of membrane protease activity